KINAFEVDLAIIYILLAAIFMPVVIL
ncbi:MAG: hypothetical protein HW396_1240, partial [Candidatus Dadabacteria bacterium]|nr:hypothetical protein [Candidatus Dadabacteria bacterium]